MAPGKPANITIRPCRPDEEPLMSAIVCDAARAYKGVIPADRYHEPYMPLSELREHKKLAGMQLLQRGNRLSITPVDPDEWNLILNKMAGERV